MNPEEPKHKRPEELTPAERDALPYARAVPNLTWKCEACEAMLSNPDPRFIANLTRGMVAVMPCLRCGANQRVGIVDPDAPRIVKANGAALGRALSDRLRRIH